MNIQKELEDINKKLLSIQNFDLVSFVYNYKRMIHSIYHFHNTIGKNAKTKTQLSQIKYNLKGMKRPVEFVPKRNFQ